MTGGSQTRKQSQRRLGTKEVREMIELRHAGETIDQLAEQFGVHRTTVMAHLRRQGVPGRPRSKKWTENTLQVEAERYRAGASLADIAADYAISPSTVARRLARAGVEFRPRPGWE